MTYEPLPQEVIPSDFDNTEWELSAADLPAEEPHHEGYAEYWDVVRQKQGSCTFCSSLFVVGGQLGAKVGEPIKVDCDEAFIWAKNNYWDTDNRRRKFKKLKNYMHDHQRGFQPKYACAAIKYMTNEHIIDYIGVNTGKVYRPRIKGFFRIKNDERTLAKVLKSGFPFTVVFSTTKFEYQNIFHLAAEDGIFHYKGEKTGTAHQMAVSGINNFHVPITETGMMNSWGKEYGRGGQVILPLDQFQHAWDDIWTFIIEYDDN